MNLLTLCKRCVTFTFISASFLRCLPAVTDNADFGGNESNLQCPKFCECSFLGRSRPNGALAVSCRGKSRQELDLSALSVLPKDRVEVLNLSNSGLRTLSNDLFHGFTRLRKLDLSGNELETLQSSWFDDTRQLQELFLANNPISTIPEKSLEPLVNLRFIDLATPYLTCDCKMKWFRRWIVRAKPKNGRPSSKHSRVVLSSGTSCQFPARHRGKPFIATLRKDLTCSGILEPAIFSMQPSTTRVIQDGGNVYLRCKVSTMMDSEILEWLRNGKPIGNLQTYQARTYFADGGRSHISELQIRNFKGHDAGRWSCRLETPKGSVQKSVEILFLTMNASGNACPAERTVDRKGVFLWPMTFSSRTAELSCPTPPSDSSSSTGNATRQCGEDATWSDPITQDCDYVSGIFGRLKTIQESQDDGGRKNDARAVLMALRNLTMDMGDIEELSIEAEDVNLALHLAEKVALTAKESEERIMLDIVNDLLKVKASSLNKADELFRTTRRFMNILRSSSISVALSEFAIQDCTVSLADYAGITVVYVESGTAVNGNLKCVDKESDENGEQFVEAATSLELAFSSNSELESSNLVVPLRFIWYRVGGVLSQVVLFNTTESTDVWIPEHSVVGVVSNRFADVSGFMKQNSTGRMVVRWKRRSKRPVEMDDLKIAFLVADYRTGSVHWLPMDDCSPIAVTSRSISFSCPLMLGLFTLVHRWDGDEKRRADRWRTMLPLWILASSGFASACMVGAAFIYCCCCRAVQISVKLCHALVNCWLALTVLILTFALGIDRVTEDVPCMVVAILLHYATLAVTLWFFLVVRTLQRKLRKLVYPKVADLSDGEAVSYNDGRPKPRHGPLVGMYFLAWGLPAMPCAFTLPLRMDSYTSNEEFCFMEANFIALVAFAIPVVVLTFTTAILLTNAFRLQKELESGRNNSKDTRMDFTVIADESVAQDTSNGPIANNTADRTDAISAVSTVIDEDDGGARRHLVTMGSVFVLTLLSYGFGATLMTRPWLLLDWEHLENYFVWTFSGLYALAVSLVALIIFWSYVIGRQKSVVKGKMTPNELANVLVVRRPDVEKERKAPRKRRSRPPTVTAAASFSAEGAVSYLQDSTIDTGYDPAVELSISRRTANAGTTVTRPPSEQSGTVAPSGTNVSAARSHRIQQAVARKYYEKQRALKMNSSAAGDEEAGSGKRATEMDNGDESAIGAENEDSEKLDPERSVCDFDGASAFSKLSNLSRGNGKGEKRRPSVELYRKPVPEPKSVTMARKNGQLAAQQSGSDEDSAPEALRNLEQNGRGTDGFLDGSSPAGRGKLLRVRSNNETCV